MDAMRRPLCDSAKRGQLCIDDLCHTGGETLCGFDLQDYEDMVDEEDDCSCDATGEDGCPVHYPIDDGDDDDDCMDCGTCDSCIARTKAAFEEQEVELKKAVIAELYKRRGNVLGARSIDELGDVYRVWPTNPGLCGRCAWPEADHKERTMLKPHQERVVVEKRELDEKVVKLHAFCRRLGVATRERVQAWPSFNVAGDIRKSNARPATRATQAARERQTMTRAMDEKFSNQLSDAQVERLAILSEELGEAQQAIGKILRHGYESYNPVVNTGMTNRRELERECGDVYEAILMLAHAKDINDAGVNARQAEKHKSIQKWLHHQEGKP
jgi:hypothetical protein